jgi:hypothetical protein
VTDLIFTKIWRQCVYKLCLYFKDFNFPVINCILKMTCKMLRKIFKIIWKKGMWFKLMISGTRPCQRDFNNKSESIMEVNTVFGLIKKMFECSEIRYHATVVNMGKTRRKIKIRYHKVSWFYKACIVPLRWLNILFSKDINFVLCGWGKKQ